MTGQSRLRTWEALAKLYPMRHRVARRHAAAAALAVATALAVRAVSAADDVAGRVVQYGRDALTVHLVKAPLAWVMEELGRQTAADIRGDLREPREVSADFEEVPLPEALHRLLGDQNFALIYGAEGRLRAVNLLGEPQTVAAATGPPPGSAPAPPPAASVAALVGLLDHHPPLPVGDRLGQAVGTNAATVRQLMDLGLHHEDAAVRGEAVRTIVQTLEADPGMRASWSAAMSGMDDATLANLLRNAAGDRAEEFVMQFMTQPRATEMRVRASAVLQKLKSH